MTDFTCIEPTTTSESSKSSRRILAAMTKEDFYAALKEKGIQESHLSNSLLGIAD